MVFGFLFKKLSKIFIQNRGSLLKAQKSGTFVCLLHNSGELKTKTTTTKHKQNHKLIEMGINTVT